MATRIVNGIIKQDFMVKRSQMKSFFTTENYKCRWFVLTNETLSYHDGTLEAGVGKEKGKVQISSIRAIEEVEEDALNKKNVMQIVYSEGGDELVILYIVASSIEQRSTWIRELRETCERSGSRLNERYHPGVYQSKSKCYTCCSHIDKNSIGCKGASFKTKGPPAATSPINAVQGRPIPPIPPVNVANRPPVPLPVEEKYKRVIAKFDYQSAEDGDLDLVKGEEYWILDDTVSNWWKAKNKHGRVGYIPANYISEISNSGLEGYDYYYDKTSRSQSEAILKRDGKEGCFLVRESSTQGKYTLSLLTMEQKEGLVRHYHIKQDEAGQYYFSERHAQASIPLLIHYHKHNSAGLMTRLRSPPSDKASTQPTTAGFGHDKWEIDPLELSIGEELGRGQFGAVNKATYRGVQTVAVKMMHGGAMKEDDFIQEAEVMKEMQHPNLVQLYGVCTKKRPIIIVTEFMANGALLHYIRRRKGKLMNQANTLLDMVIQVGGAMKFLEQKKFIHRDLAARNCLVGVDNVVKVGDFGLARFVIDDEYQSSNGTKFPIRWAAPEVLGYTRFSSKSDIWSFGVLMWEIFSGGEMPYGKMKNADVVSYVSNNDYRLGQPQAANFNIYKIMKECWKREAEDRPTFKELHKELTQLQEEGDYVS